MNIFLTTSPLQLVCALEAKSHYNTKQNILLIGEEKTSSGKKQIKELLANNHWDNILFLKRKNKIYNLFSILKKLKSINPTLSFDNFLCADFFSWQTNVILNNITLKKQIIIDDGTSIIMNYEQLLSDDGNKINLKKNLRTSFRNNILTLLNINKPRDAYSKDNISIFSAFELKKNNINIVENNFSYIQKQLNTQSSYEANAKVGFIGQGLVNDKCLSIVDYVELIKIISKKHPEGIIYFPHRSESLDVQKEIKKLTNITYHHSTYPLELELAKKNIKLSTMYGITSSASVTIDKIYKDLPVFDISVPKEMYQCKKTGGAFEFIKEYLSLSIADLPEWESYKEKNK